MLTYQTFEHLPDELLLQICRYLYPSDILLAFCGLNNRLNRTISDFIHHIQFSSEISYKNYLYLLQNILPSIWSSIESLTIRNCPIPCLTNVFLKTIENILPTNLKRLCLFHVNLHDIYQFVIRLTNNCQVEELFISCTDLEFEKERILYGYKIAQILFYHHPTLKSIELYGDLIFDLSHLSFLSLSNNEDSNLMMTININHSFFLQRLTIPLQSLSSLHLLLIHQPYLEYFNVHIDNAKTIYDYKITSFPSLMNLREFHFHSDDLAIKFEDIAELLSYFPHLKSFSLDLITECQAFFDGDILQTLVHSLETFQFSIARFMSPSAEEQTLSTFYTRFWLETKKWNTQAYWNLDVDDNNSAYYHIYSVPFSFSHLHIRRCTNENLLSQERFSLYSNVKLMILSETSDINVIPFLKRCPNLQTISLDDVYDDEENYGTDEEEDTDDDKEEVEDNMVLYDSQSSDLSKSCLSKLLHVHYIIVINLPGSDLTFLERLVDVTPNLNRLRMSFDDLRMIVRQPQHYLCQLLREKISQLEIQLEYSWLSLDIPRDILKIIDIFSHVRSLAISFYSKSNNLPRILKELFINLAKLQRNLVCITIDNRSPSGFDCFNKQNEYDSIKIWLLSSLKSFNHLEFKKSSMTIWL